MRKKMVIFMIIVSLIPHSVSALSLSCQSCILMDMDSKRVLYEKDIDTKRLIASTTKIMTAILAIESNKLDDIVTIGEEVLAMYGSNIYIELGEKISLRDLVYGLMLRSGNDAAIVIATYIAGSEEKFVKMMNEKAKKIGMKSTIYANSHGLDEETQNYSTAYDMALLSSYAYKNPTYRKIVATKKYEVQTDKKFYNWTNRNKFLFTYDYATGGKTGYTPSAGRTLVTNASKDNFNLTAVTLNDGNEYVSHKQMYEHGFNNYKKYLILDRNNFKIDDGFFKNKVYIKNSFSYPLTTDEKEKVKVFVELVNHNHYKNGDKVGMVKVVLDNETIYKDSVYVRISNHSKNMVEKIKDWLF